MTVKELFDKYCKVEDGEYIVHGHWIALYMTILTINMQLDLPETRIWESMTL